MANINAGDASGRWGGTLSENQLSTYTTLEDKIQEEREKRLAKMREKSNKELSEKQIKLVDDLIRKEFRLRERLDTEAR